MGNKEKTSKINKFLMYIEKKGNKLPDPITLFVYLAITIIILSELLYRFGVNISFVKLNTTTQNLDKVIVEAKSLLTADGIRFMLEKAVTNFTSFAPVGIVIVTLFGIAAADGTGLLSAIVKKILYGVSEKYLVPVIIFLGVLSNIASDAGYIMVLPLAGMIFLSLNKNPLIGIAAGFYGVSAGFSANLLLGSIDPLLGDLSTSGARIIIENYSVAPTANYYFMFASTFLIVLVGTLVNNYIIEKMLADREFEKGKAELSELTDLENRGLKYALISMIIFLLLIGILIYPNYGILRNQVTNSIIMNSPFIKSIVILIALLFFITGVFYGIGAKTIKNDKDLIDKMEPMINTMGKYLILTFVAAQFVAYFKYSNVGMILAFKGADLLKSTGIVGIPLLVLFIIISAFINLFIGSSVTKWSIFSNVFVPMFLILNISPELTQLAYRIGDSATNIISPLMPFFGIVLVIANKFDKKVGMGTIISIMIPYSLILLFVWSIVFVIWLLLGIPIGPNVIPFIM